MLHKNAVSGRVRFIIYQMHSFDNLFLISFGYVSLAFSSSLYNPIARDSSQIGFGLRAIFFFLLLMLLAITSLNANNNFHIRAGNARVNINDWLVRSVPFRSLSSITQLVHTLV